MVEDMLLVAGIEKRALPEAESYIYKIHLIRDWIKVMQFHKCPRPLST